jgi:hypothetical protein
VRGRAMEDQIDGIAGWLAEQLGYLIAGFIAL